ncbi:hypothetical protein [Nonomuraea sp. NPDC023979]|uniref:hypothetical protein n=1 Tax=Nonomuraea sp. NPDC023979 TaxID=3154796 RepID=UPI0033FD87A1
MTDQRLRELFGELAETLPEGSSRAGELWRQGTRSRARRRWTVLAAATAVTGLVVAANVVTGPEQAERGVTGRPTPAASPGPVLDTAPPAGDEAALPAAATALPERWAAIPVVRTAPGPVLALAEFGDGRVHVLKSGGRFPLDVKLGRAGDGGTPLRPNSLAPDGTMAAFPQQDEIVVVDLVIGQTRRYPVPGRNAVVLWRGERLLVEQEKADYLLDLATGEVTRQPNRGFGGVAGYRDLRIVPIGGRTFLREGAAQVELAVDGGPATAVPGRHGWQRDGLVAVPGRAPGERPGRADAVVVAEAATGRVVRTLLLPGARCGKGGCPVRGWARHGTVLVESGDRLLGWDLATGALSRVADLRPDVTAYSLRSG